MNFCIIGDLNVILVILHRCVIQQLVKQSCFHYVKDYCAKRFNQNFTSLLVSNGRSVGVRRQKKIYFGLGLDLHSNCVPTIFMDSLQSLEYCISNWKTLALLTTKACHVDRCLALKSGYVKVITGIFVSTETSSEPQDEKTPRRPWSHYHLVK